MKVILTVVEGPHQGARFEFQDHDTFLVGRSPDVQFRLPLKDKTLSRIHFLIEVNPPLCRIMDMASTNGLRINGKLLHLSDLQDGDLIDTGVTSLRLTLEDRDTTEVIQEGSTTSAWMTTPVMETCPVFPNYEIERTIGQGGMGVVYQALRGNDGQRVALKVIQPAVAAKPMVLGRFLREASLLRKFNHPGIVPFLDMGFTDGRFYLAMEYVEGPSVADLLKSFGPLSISTAVGLARQVLKTLQYAHGLGSVHRDIKPENILLKPVGPNHKVLLADFGLAKIYHESSLSGLSLSGQIGGTLAYMPPEQITHFKQARPPADLYAVGACLYALLTGKKIFEMVGRPEQQVSWVLFREPDPIQSHRPELPDALASIIHQSLAKAPADRFADAKAMAAALAPFTKRGQGR